MVDWLGAGAEGYDPAGRIGRRVGRERRNETLCGGGRGRTFCGGEGNGVFLAPSLEVERVGTVEIPGAEKEGEKIRDGRTLEAQAGIFPVSEAWLEIGILIGEIDAAGVADTSVNDNDFTMIAIVLETVDTRVELVGRSAVDAVIL